MSLADLQLMPDLKLRLHRWLDYFEQTNFQESFGERLLKDSNALVQLDNRFVFLKVICFGVFLFIAEKLSG